MVKRMNGEKKQLDFMRADGDVAIQSLCGKLLSQYLVGVLVRLRGDSTYCGFIDHVRDVKRTLNSWAEMPKQDSSVVTS